MIKVSGGMRGAVRGFVAATALLLATGAAFAQTSVTVRPTPGAGWQTPGSPTQDSGVPPTFQQYSIWDRLFGTGGAIFPGYVSPIDDRQDTRIALLTGGGEGRLVFAAGTADSRCQSAQAPRISVVSAPPGVQLTTDYGPFTVRANDAGSTRCFGQSIRGTRVFLSGRAPRGATATLRVAYPRVGRTGGTYTHTVVLPSK